ncbi:hypothetical protein G6F48_012658 [Rhizopus delemar]|uniref:Integrase zinc-binding domain-containing protein n=1 Tax=Rhizopus oryzae TaxID=64495 RepID=A0A9P6XVH9_RHIOR|nr:hypothetical protein G6F51_012811 [Rhizopus arrhizus]KAG1577469.1 hypothetical protein G6F48_012658 [Rhizopus delemar]
MKLDNILPDKLFRLYPPKEPVEHEQDLNEGKRIVSFRGNYVTSNSINNKRGHRAHIKHNVSINVALVDHKPTTSDTLPYVYSATHSDDIVNYNRNLDISSNFHSFNKKFNDSNGHNDFNRLHDKNIFYVQFANLVFKDYFVSPDSEHRELMTDAHNKVGHYGAEQMVRRLLHWPNLISDCVKFVRQCNECMKHNIEKKGYHPLRSIYSYYPGDHYAIDLGGPMHTT